MNKLYLSIFLLLFCGASIAQNRVIQGKITDEKGEPVVGAVVVVDGTSKGTTTEKNGSYSISVDSNKARLIFSSIGYLSQTVPVEARSRIDVVLVTAQYDIEELVVVGYGSMRKSDLTGSVSTVNSDDIVDRSVSTVNEALQGRIAGVQVTTNDGAPGAGISMKIRGGTSINASSAPLYVVDGFFVEGTGLSYGDAAGASRVQNPLTDINPADILSIEVLKDASATAIYGSRGANGVVLITTKQGSSGAPTISYTGSYGVQEITKTLPVLNTYQFVDLMDEIGLINSDTYWETHPVPVSTNFQDEIYRIGRTIDQQVSVSGGSGKTNYYASGGYLDNQGIVINSMYRRFTARLNLQTQINRFIRFSTNNNVANITEKGLFQAKDNVNSGVVTKALIIRPDRLVTTENLDTGEEIYEDAVNNPVLMAKEVADVTQTWSLTSNNALEIHIFKNLIFKTTLGVKSVSGIRELYYPSDVGQGVDNSGLAINIHKAVLNLLNENTLSYNQTFNKHALSAVVGATIQRNELRSWTYSTSQFAVDDLGSEALSLGSVPLVPENSRYVSGMISYLGRVNYTYDNRYLFTVSIRADGSSRFAKGKQWGYFPSGAFAWKLSEEDFIKNLDIFDLFKLRASWGVTGNQDVGQYAAQNIYEISTGYTFDGDTYNKAVVTPNGRIGNPDITWEKTRQTNVGLDLALFKTRLQFTADYYYKKTVDMLFKTILPSSSGVGHIMRNCGSVENKGVEFAINGVPVTNKDVTWQIDANIAFNRNKVLSLGGDQFVYVDPTWKSGVANEAILLVGQPVGLWWGYKTEGVFQWNDPRLYHYTAQPAVTTTPTTTPGPGDYIYKEVEADGVVDDKDKMVIGCSQPLFTGGFASALSYKGFDLKLLFSFSYGNDIFNANRAISELMSLSQNQSTAVLNRWRAPDLDESGKPIAGTGNPSNTMAAAGRVPLKHIISNWIEDGSYLRLQSVVLSYTLPQSVIRKIHLKNAKVWVSAQNLWTWTNYSGYDPEVNTGQGGTSEIAPGLDFGAYPRARTLQVGLSFSL